MHEYYHNINGSQVTGQSPFEIWLNEAVTVHIQRERERDIFGHGYMRVKEIIYASLPSVGPLAADRSPVSMAVEPEGFNTTHELISAMTYSKAPEFVRMVELILGKRAFVRGLADYYQKYAYSNATTAQWIDEMAKQMETSSRERVDLHRFGCLWLKRTGYPTLRVTRQTFDSSAQTFTISFSQTGWEG